MILKQAGKPLAALTFLIAALLIATTGVGAASAQKNKRIAALTPFSANVLAYTGVRPVAIGSQAAGSKKMAPKLKGVKQLALSHPNGPNMEEIAKLDPDVVLSSPTWSKGSKTMRDLAIQVRMMDPAGVGQVVRQIRAIGNSYSSKKRTDAYANKIAKQIKYASSGRKITNRPSVLMLLGVGRSPQAFMSSTWGASIIKAAGGRLVTGGLSATGGFAKVSDEWIIGQNPDIIIAVPHGNAKDVPAIADFYRNNPAWSTLDAVKNNNVKVVVDDALLQPDVDAGNTIKRVRTQLLNNW